MDFAYSLQQSLGIFLWFCFLFYFERNLWRSITCLGAAPIFSICAGKRILMGRGIDTHSTLRAKDVS